MGTTPQPHGEALQVYAEGGAIRVVGEIDAHTVPSLGEALRSLHEDATVDLSGVGFIDSSGLRVLIESHQMFEERGHTLTIYNPSPAVDRIFQLSVVDEYLNITRP
jgi:anti-sigma B factor antagonist